MQSVGILTVASLGPWRSSMLTRPRCSTRGNESQLSAFGGLLNRTLDIMRLAVGRESQDTRH